MIIIWYVIGLYLLLGLLCGIFATYVASQEPDWREMLPIPTLPLVLLCYVLMWPDLLGPTYRLFRAQRYVQGEEGLR